MKVPIAKAILDAIRTEHLPQAACVSAEIGLARCRPTSSNRQGRLTWNKLKWAKRSCAETTRPLQDVLAKIEKEPPKTVQLELYVHWTEPTGRMSGLPRRMLLDIDREGRAFVISWEAWLSETNKPAPYVTEVPAEVEV